MTNREHMRNLLAQLTAELAAMRPDTPAADLIADAGRLDDCVHAATTEASLLDPEAIEEAYHVKPLYDRLKVIVANERTLRNHLDRIALSADHALDLCNRLSAQVEEDSPPEDDAL
jgi:hypothetical protein